MNISSKDHLKYLKWKNSQSQVAKHHVELSELVSARKKEVPEWHADSLENQGHEWLEEIKRNLEHAANTRTVLEEVIKRGINITI